MQTTLDVYCAFTGCQGGTLAQALQTFRSWPMPEKDRFCSAVFRVQDTGNLADPENFLLFTRARIGLK